MNTQDDPTFQPVGSLHSAGPGLQATLRGAPADAVAQEPVEAGELPDPRAWRAATMELYAAHYRDIGTRLRFVDLYDLNEVRVDASRQPDSMMIFLALSSGERISDTGDQIIIHRDRGFVTQPAVDLMVAAAHQRGWIDITFTGDEAIERMVKSACGRFGLTLGGKPCAAEIPPPDSYSDQISRAFLERIDDLETQDRAETVAMVRRELHQEGWNQLADHIADYVDARSREKFYRDTILANAASGSSEFRTGTQQHKLLVRSVQQLAARADDLAQEMFVMKGAAGLDDVRFSQALLRRGIPASLVSVEKLWPQDFRPAPSEADYELVRATMASAGETYAGQLPIDAGRAASLTSFRVNSPRA